MPKTVYFIRHAKSSWDHLGLKDHDRPLNKRGLRDAPMMATKLLEEAKSLGQIITSSAERAKETADFFKSAFDIPDDRYHEEPKLYHGAIEDYLEGVRVWGSDEYDSAALFAHNPGMTYLANNFAKEYIDNMPTCGISKVVFDVDQFSEISKHNGQLVALYYPKMYI